MSTHPRNNPTLNLIHIAGMALFAFAVYLAGMLASNTFQAMNHPALRQWNYDSLVVSAISITISLLGLAGVTVLAWLGYTTIRQPTRGKLMAITALTILGVWGVVYDLLIKTIDPNIFVASNRSELPSAAFLLSILFCGLVIAWAYWTLAKRSKLINPDEIFWTKPNVKALCRGFAIWCFLGLPPIVLILSTAIFAPENHAKFETPLRFVAMFVAPFAIAKFLPTFLIKLTGIPSSQKATP